jgi:pimeloyl-ACP methyl ester carboxylesterase
MEMKQNAAAAAVPERDPDDIRRNGQAGLVALAEHLARLQSELPNLEIHLVGHSAGSILLGHLLERFAIEKLRPASVHLYAAACTVPFAVKHYGRAIKEGRIDPKRFYSDVLSDERELADTVGRYGKSLLYLVSRALEDVHKMPLLGMQAAWEDVAHTVWHRGRLDSVRAWRDIASTIPRENLGVHSKDRADVSDGERMIRLAHGSFDNDVDVVTKTLERIVGGRLGAKVESLHGF